MTDPAPFTGAIPRVEASETHRDFVRAATPASILVPITEARKLVNKGETAASFYGPETAAITTTTVRDEYLQWITPEDEFEIVRAFGSVGHVPVDHSVYEDQSPDKQLELVTRYLEGVLWLSERFADHEAGAEAVTSGTGAESDGGAAVEGGPKIGGDYGVATPSARHRSPAFAPLVKGLNAPERAVAYRVFEDVGAEQYSFYGAQYFSGGAGPTELVADIREVAAETDHPLFVIGLLSPTYLRRLPDNVVAASGLNQWHEAVQPRENADAPEEMRCRWREFADVADAALE